MKIKLNNYNIKYIGNNFTKHFCNMEFEIPKKLKLEYKVLDKTMSDKVILEKFSPKEVNLGEFIWALENCKDMLKNSYANIFYIRDKNNTLWAVNAGWNSVYRGWYVSAYSVEDPDGWNAGVQVLSRKFSSLALEPLDSLSLETRIKDLESDMAKIKKIINL